VKLANDKAGLMPAYLSIKNTLPEYIVMPDKIWWLLISTSTICSQQITKDYLNALLQRNPLSCQYFSRKSERLLQKYHIVKKL